MTAVLAGGGVFLVALSIGHRPMLDLTSRYLMSPSTGRSRCSSSLPGGLATSSGVGLVIGSVLLPLPIVSGAVSGVVVGAAAFLVASRRSSRRVQRAIAFELPAIADLLSLYLLSGDSVLASIGHVVADTSGESQRGLQDVLDRVDEGLSLPDALATASRETPHADARRLYLLLAQAHRSGARLVEALEMFAADRRSALDRALVEEGGRRALAGYGPILGLMIPTTLLFLIYPTLRGLDALGGTQ